MNNIFPLIYKFTGGVPRFINILCGWTLYVGYMNDKHELDIKEVEQAIEELRAEQVIPFKENRATGYSIEPLNKISEMNKRPSQCVEISAAHRIGRSANAQKTLETHTVGSSKPKKRRFWSSWV